MMPTDRRADLTAEAPLRRLQEARFAESAALMAGLSADLYRAACTLTGRTGDALADCLADEDTAFDLRHLAAAHDHLAAHWRHHRAPADLSRAAEDWQSWLATELRIWAIAQPALLRSLCLAMVRADTPSGRAHQADIATALGQRYPLTA